MSWSVVARKEFRDASRSRTLWILTALFVLIIAGAAYVVGFALSSGPGAEATGTALVSALTGRASLFLTSFVPILGLMASYASVVGERASGSVKVLLGLPHSRRDVVLGKFVGRSAVLAVALLVGYFAGFVVMLSYEELAVVDYLGFIILTTLLGVVYVAVGVGVSAGVASRSRAAASVVGVYIFLKVLWDAFPAVVPRAVVYLTTGTLSPPDWYDFLVALGPNAAYTNLSAGYLERDFGSLEAFSAVVILAWVVVPVALGYARFRASDV
ncbi:MAG: ABC transporter permease [Halobacteriales archaeon]